MNGDFAAAEEVAAQAWRSAGVLDALECDQLAGLLAQRYILHCMVPCRFGRRAVRRRHPCFHAGHVGRGDATGRTCRQGAGRAAGHGRPERRQLSRIGWDARTRQVLSDNPNSVVGTFESGCDPTWPTADAGSHRSSCAPRPVLTASNGRNGKMSGLLGALRYIEIGFGDGVLRCWPIRRSQAEAIAKAAVRRRRRRIVTLSASRSLLTPREERGDQCLAGPIMQRFRPPVTTADHPGRLAEQPGAAGRLFRDASGPVRDSASELCLGSAVTWGSIRMSRRSRVIRRASGRWWVCRWVWAPIGRCCAHPRTGELMWGKVSQCLPGWLRPIVVPSNLTGCREIPELVSEVAFRRPCNAPHPDSSVPIHLGRGRAIRPPLGEPSTNDEA